jgi:hypothetical protein
MNGLIYQIQRFVIDKSTSFQTICQTKNIINKCYQTISNQVYGYMGYSGYKGLLSIPPHTPISHIETLNVSHNEMGAYRGGYIKRYQTIPIGIYKAYAGYKGLNGLRLNGLKEKMVWGFFILKNFTPKEC